MAWEYDRDKLMVVCKECHSKIHRALVERKQVKKYRIGYIISQYLKELHGKNKDNKAGVLQEL